MTRCTVGELPIWLGAQATPKYEVAPFGFMVGEHGLVRMDNRDIVARMVDAYGSDDYHFITSPPGASDWGNKLARYSISGLIDTYGSIEGKNILEVGGGTLYSADTMIREFGAAHVTLVDPAVAETQSTDRIEVRREYFGKETVIERDIDLIVSINTVEHVPNPIEFLAAMRDRLSADGKLYLKMPECGESLAMSDLGLCVHEHLSYFTLASLDTCLAAVGLRRVAESNCKGALQVLAERGDIDHHAYCVESDALVERFCATYRIHLDRLRDKITANGWRKIAFVGCSVGLSNVLNLLDLAKILEVGLFDNDDLKKGRYLPGCDCPIDLPSAEALSKYDAIFVTPVNFYDEIAAGLRRKHALADTEIHPVFEPV